MCVCVCVCARACACARPDPPPPRAPAEDNLYFSDGSIDEVVIGSVRVRSSCGPIPPGGVNEGVNEGGVNEGDSSDDEAAQKAAQKAADSSDDEVAQKAAAGPQKPAVTKRAVTKRPSKNNKPAPPVPAASDPLKQCKFRFRISVGSVGQDDPICQQGPVLPELGEDNVVGRFLFAPTAALLELWPGQVDVESGGYICKVVKYDKRTKIATLKFHDGTQYLKWDTLMSFKALN